MILYCSPIEVWIYLFFDYEKLFYLLLFTERLYPQLKRIIVLQFFDENPTLLTLTIASGWNRTFLKNKEKYTFFYLKKNLWELGQEKIKTPYGNTVLVYSKESSLAEMIGKMDKSDRNLVLHALRPGLKNNLLDRALLLDYAEHFKSRTLARTYLEAIE